MRVKVVIIVFFNDRKPLRYHTDFYTDSETILASTMRFLKSKYPTAKYLNVYGHKSMMYLKRIYFN